MVTSTHNKNETLGVNNKKKKQNKQTKKQRILNKPRLYSQTTFWKGEVTGALLSPVSTYQVKIPQ